MKTPEAIAGDPLCVVEVLKARRRHLLVNKSLIEAEIDQLSTRIDTLEAGKRIERERGRE